MFENDNVASHVVIYQCDFIVFQSLQQQQQQK